MQQKMFNFQSLEETNGENIQFRSKTVYRFLPELSSGKIYIKKGVPPTKFLYGRKGLHNYYLLFSSGSESDRLTVLNMVTLTAFNKARNSPNFVSVETDCYAGGCNQCHYFRSKVAFFFLSSRALVARSHCSLRLLEVRKCFRHLMTLITQYVGHF